MKKDVILVCNRLSVRTPMEYGVLFSLWKGQRFLVPYKRSKRTWSACLSRNLHIAVVKIFHKGRFLCCL
jgi:hypothetical protein